jgi:methanogenic corrinoid protein MtbC1
MTKGYQIEDIKEKLLGVLGNSKTGASGLEISKKLNINRITMTKYLKVFAAEGLLKQKNIGNVNLWFIEDGTEKYNFPEDYFKIKTKYFEFLSKMQENLVYNLIRNCYHSGAEPMKIISEIISPGIEELQSNYNQGKIGKSELNFLEKIISNSIQIINLENVEINQKKNVIIVSADYQSSLLAEAASASFHTDGWQIFHLGDMSSAIDVLFDLDLQKFVTKIWKSKIGIMIVVVFSSTEDGLKFFAESVNSIKAKFRRNFYLALCGNIPQNTEIKADLMGENLETTLQWCQTTFESST